MLVPDLAKWRQNVNDLFEMGLNAAHARTRERCMALFHLASEGGGATAYAQKTGRDRCTVMDWVRNYNERGPDALVYRRSGGTVPLFQKTHSIKSSN